MPHATDAKVATGKNIAMKKLFLFLLLLLPLLAHAAEPQDPQVAINARLREGLRNTMVQLQTAQAEVANLQAVKVGDDARIKDLESKLKRLTKQSSDDKQSAERSIADLKTQVAAQDTRNAAQVAALAKWKASFDSLLAQAKAIDAKRAQLAGDKIQLTRKLEDAERKNQALYTLGTEILHRYEHYGLGDAIAAREPFTGIAKTKLQNFVQAKADHLTDAKIKD